MTNGQIATFLQWTAISFSALAALSGGLALHFRNKASADSAAILSETIGQRWTPLTTDQISSLATALSQLPHHRVQLMYSNQLGRDLAQSIYLAFEKAQWKTVGTSWDGVSLTSGGGTHFGIIAGPGFMKAGQIKRAIESTTPLKVDLDQPNQPEIPDLIYLFVGIKS